MTFKRSLTGAAASALAGAASRKIQAKKSARAEAKAAKRAEPTLKNALLNAAVAAKNARPGAKAKCKVCTARKAVNANGSCDRPRCVNVAAGLAG